jgi:hypothetical protein
MDEFERLCEIVSAFFTVVLNILSGTAIVSHGEIIGLVLYVPAVISAIWLGILLFKFIKRKREGKDEKG